MSLREVASSRSMQRIRRRFLWVAKAASGPAAVVQTLIGRVLVLSVNLMCSILTARNLGPLGRGEQSAMAMWPQFIAFIATFGLQQALVYHARRHREARDSLVTASIVWSLLLGCAASCVGIVFLPHWLGAKYDAATVRFAQLLMLMSPAVMLGITVNSIFETAFEFSASNLLRYGIPLGTLIGLVGLLAAKRFTPEATALAYILPSLLILLLMFPKATSTFVWSFADFRRSTRRLFGYGIRVYGMNVLSTFSLQIDQVLVVGLLAPAALGVYVVALNVSRVLNVFQTSIAIVLLPKVSGQAQDRILGMVGTVSRLSLAFSLAGGAVLALVMPFFMPKLFGAGFVAGVLVARILIVESVVASTVGTLIQAFMATNRPAVATALQGVGLALTVPLMIVLIPRLGLVGAALSLLGSTCARLLFGLACFPLVLRAPMPNLILRRSDLAFVRRAIVERTAS